MFYSLGTLVDDQEYDLKAQLMDWPASAQLAFFTDSTGDNCQMGWALNTPMGMYILRMHRNEYSIHECWEFAPRENDLGKPVSSGSTPFLALCDLIDDFELYDVCTIPNWE